MSLDAIKSRILCDNTDCAQDTRLPIAVRSDEISARATDRRSSAAGWLFVRGAYEDRHYCPDCRTKVLR